LAAVALARRSLTAVGALAGLAVGLGLYWAGGPAVWVLLALFFVSSTLLSRLGHAEKESAEELTGKGDRRDAVQVLANGGPALAMAALWRLTAVPGFYVGAITALAAANADTWASEIGLLSRRQPVSLVGLRPVPRGRSGGVTATGLAASLGGALLIAAGFLLTRLAGGERLRVGTAGVIAAGGFLGSVVDSFLGATLQGRYRSLACEQYTERPHAATGAQNTLTGGLRLVTNDTVNLVSGLVVSGAAVLVSALSG
jgi:uncharacterized protein (TIGR00297 family)